jgi:hypothetical protein
VQGGEKVGWRRHFGAGDWSAQVQGRSAQGGSEGGRESAGDGQGESGGRGERSGGDPRCWG